MARNKHPSRRRRQEIKHILRVVSAYGELIRHERDPQRLLNEACALLREAGAYRLVWVGLPEGGRLRLLAAAESAKGGALDMMAHATPEQWRRLPEVEALQTRHVIVCRYILRAARYAPWREELAARGIRSMIAAPILDAANLYGVLVVFAKQSGRFAPEEVELIKILADDLAFGLRTIAEDAERHRAEEALRNAHEERIAAVERLRDSEAFRTRIFESSRVPIVVIDAESLAYIECNPAAVEIYGLARPEEILGKTPLDFSAAFQFEGEASAEKFYAYIVQAQREGQIVFEWRHRRPTSEIWDAEVHLMSFQAGQRPLMQFTLHDITERRLVEQSIRVAQRELQEMNRDLERRVAERTAQLKEAKDYFELVFNFSPDAAMITRLADARIENINDGFTALFGYAREELIGKFLDDISPWVNVPDRDYVLSEVERAGFCSDYEVVLRRKDGNHIVCIIAAKMYTHQDVPHVITVARDMTERKKAQEELRESRDQLSIVNAALEKASRLKDEFLASMSHELRTPLSGILGLTEVLQEGIYGPLNAKQRKSVATIETAGRHLLELINDILDLSKVEAGKLDVQIGICRVVDVCEASLHLVKGMANQKQITVACEMPTTVPTINADARRLKQMLVNLLSNAIKFTPAGGSIGLIVKEDHTAQQVSFTVWDTGIGIKPEHMAKLFQPFVQLDSSLARQFSGTGLGLSLVRRMTELHNGGIVVESAVGQGSRFTIILPMAATDATLYPLPEPDGDDDEATPVEREGATPLVLIADDNEQLLDMVATYLSAHGFEVHAVHSGFELLECAPGLNPDMILVDIQMPGLDGLEVIRRLRAHSDPRLAATPITAVTALAMPGDRERCLAAGADAYLSKPFILRRLVAHIRQRLA